MQKLAYFEVLLRLKPKVCAGLPERIDAINNVLEAIERKIGPFCDLPIKLFESSPNSFPSILIYNRQDTFATDITLKWDDKYDEGWLCGVLEGDENYEVAVIKERQVIYVK
ncbi:MAG: hypothetical protein H6Q71_1978 [Firmicutes bacterium]|nr:hypothetical protein [Bacillota bacterium]